MQRTLSIAVAAVATFVLTSIAGCQPSTTPAPKAAALTSTVLGATA